MTNIQIALTALISITLTGHTCCALYIYKKCKKHNQPSAAWLLAAMCTGLLALAYYQMKNNKDI